MSGLIPADVQAVFFDAVGTLIYPHPPAPAVYAEVGRRHGSQLNEATIADRFRVAFQREEEIDAAAGWRTGETRETARWRNIVHDVLFDAADAAACFKELYTHFSRPSSWHIDPDAGHVLQELTRRDFVLGIASNYDHRLRTVAAGLPEFRCITHFVISAEVGWRKPAAQFFAEICRLTRLVASRILVIGDDWMNDYEGARAAGMHAILVDRLDRNSLANRIRRLTEMIEL
jgi:putative hydrolase of the HAD superfamily